MARSVSAGEEIRREMLCGAALLADSVKASLGPKGRNALLDRSPAGPLVTNNGGIIAGDVDLRGQAATGARLLQAASEKTKAVAGGGGVTAVLLAYEIILEGYRNLAAGADPMELRKGIKGAARLACVSLGRLAKPADTREILRQIAFVSSSDEQMAELVAEALERGGPDGVITVDESGIPGTTLRMEEGMQFQRGYLSPEMITDPETRMVHFTEPCILITDEKITRARELLPILERSAGTKKPLFIIADSIEGEALALLMTNITKGILKAAAVNAPAYGEGRRGRLSDLAVFTGAAFVGREQGIALGDVTPDMLGSVDSLRVSRHATVLSGPGGDPEGIRIRKEALRRQIAGTDYDFEREQLKERLSKLSGGAALLTVGAATETEGKERKILAESAIGACRAAMEEGIVPGGGTAYLAVQPALQAYIETLWGDRKTGAKILLRALESPLRQIAENAGFFGGTVLGKLGEYPSGTGFDVGTGRFVNMLEAGIIDPAKVCRTAIESAASVAALFLTAEAGVMGE
ncbi:MAG: molecular chaperone GroEL [Lachnospiraceae bacterium]|nr:molecular chaperone GroEL [Lachnospiraceae bacterium]